jgi:hypothetical protein
LQLVPTNNADLNVSANPRVRGPIGGARRINRDVDALLAVALSIYELFPDAEIARLALLRGTE